MLSTADVQTTAARRYLQQLCKHWSGAFPSHFTPEHGEIELPLGVCALEADDGRLRLRLEPKAEADLARFEGVVAEHLQRFACAEQLEITWRRDQPGG